MARVKNENKIKYLAIFILIILIIGIAIYYFSGNNYQQGIIGNKRILDEVIGLLTISGQRTLLPSDFTNLESMVKGDVIAEDYTADAKQFSKYGINTHAGHALGDLYSYVLTGKDQVCIHHEIEHLGTFIRFNDFSRSDDILAKYNTSYGVWYQNALQEKSKFPVLYQNLDQLVVVLNRTVANYEAGNYQAVIADIPFITQNDFLGCALASGV